MFTLFIISALLLTLPITGGQATASFSCDTISDATFQRMYGKSIPYGHEGIRRSLRYLRVLHVDGEGKTRQGEIVCNEAIANDLLDIFRRLYEAQYPIESIRLIDDYNAEDEASMAANNTTCFCYRTISGSAKLSSHSAGMAVDINPLYNPCVKRHRSGKTTVQPAGGTRWSNRSHNFKYKIAKNDLCYRLFKEHGFIWGGDWKNTKDYQHFEKNSR